MTKMVELPGNLQPLIMSAMNQFVLPFPVLRIPPYVEVTQGKWDLRRVSPPPNAIRGYFRGHQVMEFDNWILYERQPSKAEIWMSITPMELESSAHHLLAAKGSVLVAGLGMGLLPWNLAQKKEVTSITIVERDREVIMLMKEVVTQPGWEAYRDKVVLLHDDVLFFKPALNYDVALIDIWDGVGDMRIRPDMTAIAKNIRAREYAAWGMEFDFVSWLIDCKILPRSIRARHWREYSEAIGIPLIMREYDMMSRLALRAAEVAVLGYDL